MLDYVQPIPSDTCSGCQIKVGYNYSTGTLKNPDEGVLFLEILGHEAQAVTEKGGSCVTDPAFPVNYGGQETLTISTQISSAQIGGFASNLITSLLGTGLCTTTPSTTVGPASLRGESPLPTSTPAPTTSATPVQSSPSSPNSANSSTSASNTNGLEAGSSLVSQLPESAVSRTYTTTTSQTSRSETGATATRPVDSPMGVVSQPAASPATKTLSTNQKLQIIAGVVTSILGIAAIALAVLLWKRYRRLRRDSAVTDDSFFRPKPELDGGTTVAPSLFKGSVSTAPMTERKDACELAETASMDVRWRETYYEERKTIPQELKGAEPPRFEMDASGARRCSISPLTP